MSYLRMGMRLAALLVCNGAMYLFLVVTDLGLGMVERRGRSTPRRAAWRTRVFRAWTRVVGRLIGMQPVVTGCPPRAPFFLVSNHLSYVDVILLASQLPCVFVAKSEVARWPGLGRICRAVDTLFIDRESKRDIPRVMRLIEETLMTGRGVVIFPEGTSTRGARVERFRPSLLEAAARSGLPVSHASLSYRTPAGCAPAHLAVCWWGGMTFGGHFLKLLRLPGFEARLSFGEKPIRADDRKELARRLREAVERRFEPVV